jgi:catechol 2,3-dioxygenase-like lactoylglutathione lyase family enzyme
MKLVRLCIALVLGSALARSADRPKITGIDHVAFYTTAPEATKMFYTSVLGLQAWSSVPPPIEPGEKERFTIGTQWIGYSAAPDPKSNNRLDHVAFVTGNCIALRRYLIDRGIHGSDIVFSPAPGLRSFMVTDPEGHRIEFVEHTKTDENVSDHSTSGNLRPISHHMIHAGFIVRDRAAADHFYKDILDFHLYWQGGMARDHTDWVAMQVPDGTDWLEYMLNIEPQPSRQTTGVMNHISLGVKDIRQAQAELESRGWKPNDREHAQMGRDGKWQLNIYDPDSTRIELMEFRPVQKPCCSDFQGPHPPAQ